MTKVQKFSARYSWYPEAERNSFDPANPPPRSFEVKWFALMEGADGKDTPVAFYNAEDAFANLLVEKGIRVAWSLVPKASLDLVGGIKAAVCSRASDPNAAHGNGAYGFLTIETPSTLGRKEHRARQAIAERALRAAGIKFTLECSTVHSEAVCRPLSEKELAEATSLEA